MYGLTLVHHAKATNSVPPEELAAHEQQLAMLEYIIEQGVVIAIKFPQMARVLEDSMMTSRITALATRARLCTLLGREADALRLIEAVCMVMQLMRPSLHLYIQSLNSALDAAIHVKSLPHLQMLFGALVHVQPAGFPGLEHLRNRALAELHQYGDGATQPPPMPMASDLSPDQRLMMAMHLRMLAAPSQPLPQQAPISLETALASAALEIQHFAASTARMQAALSQEIAALQSL